jgi:hypothetical protein
MTRGSAIIWRRAVFAHFIDRHAAAFHRDAARRAARLHQPGPAITLRIYCFAHLRTFTSNKLGLIGKQHQRESVLVNLKRTGASPR